MGGLTCLERRWFKICGGEVGVLRYVWGARVDLRFLGVQAVVYVWGWRRRFNISWGPGGGLRCM